jgi:type IV pilus assembly protein PilY1
VRRNPQEGIMNRKISLAKRMVAYGVIASMAAQPVFAAPTDISTVPLASASGGNYMPNLLFTLDDSGSMAFNYLPDYVNDSNSCMTTSGGGTACQRGDPPFEAGGQFGFNGVAYDPNVFYSPGLSSNGQPVLNPPSGSLTPTAVPPDAYLGGTNVNITTSMSDRRYCNSAATPVCRRNGADSAGTVLPAGNVDAEGHTLGAGQFPYRTNASSASTVVSFGLPEMMPLGTFSRSATTVTATTITAHGLTTSDRIFVTSGTTGLNVLCVPVATAPNANTFTYTTSTSGTITARTASFRKCGPATFERTGNIVTATVPAGHFVVTGDIISTFVASGSPMNVTNATITVTSPTTLTYTTGTSGTIAPTAGFGVRVGLYNVTSTVSGPVPPVPPAAYRITPIEYCSDANLTNCIEVIPPAVPPASHPFPAYVRFCRTQAEALAPGAVTAIATTPPTPRCQLKFVNVTGLTVYKFPRYGWFTRDTIASTVTSYGSRPNRSDCAAAPTCTYPEEIQNYARWFAYYSDRMRMMKSAAGRSFLSFISNPTGTPPKPDRMRVGFITIHAGDTGTINTAKYLRIDNFNTTHASNFYTKFYAQVPSSATPLLEALSRAGWIFAGKLGTGLTAGIPAADDPMQASCQKNFSIFTTDGFWNGNPGQTLSAGAIGNQDNVDNQVIAPYTDFMVSRASGTFDGNILPTTVAGTSAGGSGTLADVAMYYYKTDLRGTGAGPSTSPNTTPAGGDVATNNVPAKAGAKDFVTHQHMVTFSVGLADGLMRYQPDYETALTGDFANIRNGAVAACFWAGGGVCNWPSPQANNQSALDDLWHAAANGRGTYYQALNANALVTGLSAALTGTGTVTASAAAAATSSPQITENNNKAFSTTYQTNTWSGRLFAQNVDLITAEILPPILWRADSLLLDKVRPDGDDRNIWTGTVDTVAFPDKVKPLTWTTLSTTLTAAEQAFFSNKCTPLGSMTQCATLVAPAQLDQANNGINMLAFLRGQTGLEATVFRDRTEVDPDTGVTTQTVLGDIVNAQPIFVQSPLLNFGSEGSPGETYDSFKSTNATRAGTLYVAANDGYLHAFDGANGTENWAYMPRFVMPGVYQLADSAYASQHRFFVDGTPEVADVFDTSTARWKTIVVGGANSGARGYYALDITNPAQPKGLWEFCSDSTLCPDSGAISHSDADLGFTYGNPVIGKRVSDGRWVVVVTSGLNNTSPAGTGVGFFYVLDALTGEKLHKVSTGVGDTTTPSGLMKIAGFYPNGRQDATFTHVYGGDQLGNVWRIDMLTSPPALLHMATLKDSAGRIQPITARPVATHIGSPTNRIYYVGTGRYLGDGTHGGMSDLNDPGAFSGIAWKQSIYGIRDKNVDYGANIRTGATLVTQTLTSISPTVRGISREPVDWTTQDGFVIDLNPTFPGDPPTGNSPGERVTLDLQLVLGILIVIANVPIQGGCVPGGQSFLYALDFKTGSYVSGSVGGAAGWNLGKFIVGSAIVQTADGSIKAINKDSTGGNTPFSIPDPPPTSVKRFGYRER